MQKKRRKSRKATGSRETEATFWSFEGSLPLLGIYFYMSASDIACHFIGAMRVPSSYLLLLNSLLQSILIAFAIPTLYLLTSLSSPPEHIPCKRMRPNISNEGSEVLWTLLFLLIAPGKYGCFGRVSSVAFSSICSGLLAITQCLMMGTDRHWANLRISPVKQDKQMGAWRGYGSCRSLFCWQNNIIATQLVFMCLFLKRTSNEFVGEVTAKTSGISQRKHVISKPNKFIFEFKNAHVNLPGDAE